MSEKRKTYVIVTYHHGTHEIEAEEERFARKVAIARGWWVKDISEKEKEEEKKAA